MYRCGAAAAGSSNNNNNNAIVFSSMPYVDGDSATSSATVDCTLSLATPATRDHHHYNHHRLLHNETPPPSSAPNNWSSSSAHFCWDNILHSSPSNSHKPNHGGGGGNVGTPLAADPLLARRCANCDTTSTPLWRNGPRGPKSLCNACGIRFKKEERRANAAATGGGDTAEAQQYHLVNGSPWIHHHTQTTSCYSPAAKVSEFRFIDDVDDRDSPLVSWRLNVCDRAGLVHGFTR